jgi:hypothetical protein
MTVSSLKGLLIAVTIVLLGFNPAVHILKHFDPGTKRYNVLETRKVVRSKIEDEDVIYFTNDRFIPPFLDYVYDNYAGTTVVEARWIVPYLLGGKTLEDRTIADFLCIAAGHHGKNIVWALDSGHIKSRNDTAKTVTVRLGNLRRIHVDYVFREILHEFVDGVFLRGSITGIQEIKYENGADVRYQIYTSEKSPASCR